MLTESNQPRIMETMEINSITRPTYDIAQIMSGLYGDGIIALKGAFSREWAQQLGEDIARLYAEALQRLRAPWAAGPSGTTSRFTPKTFVASWSWPRTRG